jgi:F0F1-type ATP synthase epsilon subunit
VKQKKLARAERDRIASAYGVVVPSGLSVTVLPAGASAETEIDRSWKEGAARRARMAIRAQRFEKAARKSGG